MNKSNILINIRKRFNELSIPYVPVSDSSLMFNEQTITCLFSEHISTTTFDGDDEIDWNDIWFTDLDDDLLSDILSYLEDFIVDQDKTYKRILN